MSTYEEEEQGIAPQESQELLLPIEQQTLLFYGKPILVIRLPDGRPAIVLRPFCDNMQIDANAQIKRIRRTEAVISKIKWR